MQQRDKDGDIFDAMTGDEKSLVNRFLEYSREGETTSATIGKIPEEGDIEKIYGKQMRIISVENEGFNLVGKIVEGKANGFPRPGTDVKVNGLKYEVQKLSCACTKVYMKLKKNEK